MGKKIEAGKVAYFDGQIVPVEDAKVSILTHSFNYGTALFEGIRGYYRKEDNNILIFRLKEHVDRFVRNFNVLCMQIPEDRDEIARICTELVKQSGFREGVYIRPVVYKCDQSLGPQLH
ncbi:MAG: aminotransferase class IV, partial [Candidatus Hydrogenedentales bacterium]